MTGWNYKIPSDSHRISEWFGPALGRRTYESIFVTMTFAAGYETPVVSVVALELYITYLSGLEEMG